MQDLTVVDFSANAAGPACGMLLADFGADVIKVEPPSGDATRKWGKNRFGKDGQFTGSYLSLNRNKSSVVLDLKTSEGRDAADRLIKKADVVIHSYLPGIASKLGLDADRVARLNPRAVYCAISGFSPSSPMRARPGFDMLLQAFSGHLGITGEAGRPSVRIGPSSIDLVTAAHAAFGIMVALRQRDKDGLGQVVSSSLYDNAMHLIGNHIGDFTGSGVSPQKFGSRFPNMSPYGYYQASDREFFIGVSSDEMWRRFCATVNEPALGAEIFSSNAGRLQHQQQLDEVLIPIFKSKTAKHWVETAESLAIPASLIYTIPEAVSHEQAQSFVVDTGINGVKIPGIPVSLSRTPGSIRRHAPALGEDTTRILGRVGELTSADQI